MAEAKDPCTAMHAHPDFCLNQAVKDSAKFFYHIQYKFPACRREAVLFLFPRFWRSMDYVPVFLKALQKRINLAGAYFPPELVADFHYYLVAMHRPAVEEQDCVEFHHVCNFDCHASW